VKPHLPKGRGDSSREAEVARRQVEVIPLGGGGGGTGRDRKGQVVAGPGPGGNRAGV